jgi:hypothetical protein
LEHVEATVSARGAHFHLEFPGERSVLFHTLESARQAGLLGPEEFEILKEAQAALEDTVCPFLSSRAEWYHIRLEKHEKNVSGPFERRRVYADEPGDDQPQTENAEENRPGKELDGVFRGDEDREPKKNDDSLLEYAIVNLRVLQELCESPLYNIQPEPGFAAATAFQDASKGIIDSVLSYLETEAEDRQGDRIRAMQGRAAAETGNPHQAAQT